MIQYIRANRIEGTLAEIVVILIETNFISFIAR